MAEIDDDIPANIFEERAEYLSKTQLVEWTATTDRDRAILSRLKGPGAKLLTGPRGCGKSTLLRHAYFELQDARKDLPVYVNYGRSLALEPLFHRAANALILFRQWVLTKIVLGVADSASEQNLQVPDSLSRLAGRGRRFVESLEVGIPNPPEDFLSPSQLLVQLEQWSNDLGRKRCILLLDDAAHAFSSEQQREFFEIFRELRSRAVAPKAAVYPGITSYSPNFHVGHDAELVQAWYRPEDEDYLRTMHEVVERRLPATYQDRLKNRSDLVDYLALASFGIPRGFLVMLSQLLGIEEEDNKNPTRANADVAVSEHAASVQSLFTSLSAKLPRYKHFVEMGNELVAASMRAIQAFNGTKAVDEKAVIIAYPDPLGTELTRMLEMLEYAGVVRDADTVSRGVKGVFHRYVVHYSLLVESNALSLGKRASLADIVTSLSRRDAHSFARAQPQRLLGTDYVGRCTLDLAPCQNCGAPRVSEDARFCMRCGRELSTVSVYDELLKQAIDQLPLTKKKLEGLLNYTAIRTVNDVLLDEDNRQLRSVPRVGPVWAARIRAYAEEFVSV